MIELVEGSRLASIGAALADPTRATIIASLLSGTAHTSGELARCCGVAPSTVSEHLGRLLDAGLVRVEPAGRYRHYQIASRQIADLLEQIDSIDLPETTPPKRPKTGQGLAYARSCYDHIAGRLGVDLHDACVAEGWVAIDDHLPWLTETGAGFFTDLGLDVEHLRSLRRPLLRLDLDWTERRHHLAGSLPAALLDHCISRRWINRRADKRQLTITERGRTGFQTTFRLRL